MQAWLVVMEQPYLPDEDNADFQRYVRLMDHDRAMRRMNAPEITNRYSTVTANLLGNDRDWELDNYSIRPDTADVVENVDETSNEQRLPSERSASLASWDGVTRHTV
ncbi:unnamed protein product [Didymodactylos carnosus]|uniref:Uncharacterized protein n=1 Tax=Didymodactylos carnosus TaxID=1234261 RepID=A0A8S2F225_9BILA|nr:unnamed protein product [Didymodactylos carnosus]CAF4129327.1 unnamed protein product [Didymodactylos carnosus]